MYDNGRGATIEHKNSDDNDRGHDLNHTNSTAPPNRVRVRRCREGVESRGKSDTVSRLTF